MVHACFLARGSSSSANASPLELSIAIVTHTLPGASFGAGLDLTKLSVQRLFDTLEQEPERLSQLLNDSGGLLVIRRLNAIIDDPQLLVRLSRFLGPEVEDYYQTLTGKRFFHDSIPELLVLSNRPPCNHPPPARPDPEVEPIGIFPTRFPHRRGWHTDQSYRRPPPDVSLLFAVQCPPADQGQTLYADTTAAYEALDAFFKKQIDKLYGIHAPSWIGRSERAVRAGETPATLLPHQRPQRHPLVRVHPCTGRRALYLCEDGQMDYVDGPIEGMERGPDGAGARLVRELLEHATQSMFCYRHEWQVGDLVIGDNRCLLHAPTWYDADTYTRLMWRTTVMGNAGAEYAGEEKSWISSQGYQPMHGMEDV